MGRRAGPAQDSSSLEESSGGSADAYNMRIGTHRTLPDQNTAPQGAVPTRALHIPGHVQTTPLLTPYPVPTPHPESPQHTGSHTTISFAMGAAPPRYACPAN